MKPRSALWPRTAKGTTWWSSSWQDFTAASTAWRSASSPTMQNRCRQPQPSEGVTGSTIDGEPTTVRSEPVTGGLRRVLVVGAEGEHRLGRDGEQLVRRRAGGRRAVGGVVGAVLDRHRPSVLVVVRVGDALQGGVVRDV